MKCLFIDFEYNSSNEENLNLVCASFDLFDMGDFSGKGELLAEKNHWFHGDRFSNRNFKRKLDRLEETFGCFTIVCFSANAEGRSFLAAGVDPKEYYWIDLQVEYKMMVNHCHTYMYGKQYIEGKVVTTQPPKDKFAMDEEEKIKARFDRPRTNLVACVFKLLGEKIDSNYKDKMRDLIIENDPVKIEANKKEILKYCRSDIKYLPQVLVKVIHFLSNTSKNIHCNSTVSEAFWRARSVLNTAIIENNGYPVKKEWAVNFTNNVPWIQQELAEDIISQFPEGEAPLEFEKTSKKLEESPRKLKKPKRKIKEWKEWLHKNVNTSKWVRTGTINKKTGEYGLSTAIDSWIRYFNPPRHDYGRGNYAHQIIRYLKFNQQLNGFLPARKGKAKFIDFMGSDGRVRGYLNSYGSQSARWQPKAVSFLFLKSAWMRSMCIAPKGKFICGIDYSQQEFLISALLSQDENMINAYRTGDVYLHTAKLAGAVPKDGKRKDYEKERDIYKAVTLAISYMMSKYGLADTLTRSLGREVPHDEAQDFIDAFFESYPQFDEFMQLEVVGKYESDKYLKLADGWIMYGDNPNHRSYGNYPIQGMGSCILRRAVDRCLEEGLKVVFPLHDALYIEADISERDEVIKKFDNIMKWAFGYYFKNPKEASKIIRTDINIWGRDCKEEEIVFEDKKIKSQTIYVDGRGKSEFDRFKKYMVSAYSEPIKND